MSFSIDWIWHSTSSVVSFSLILRPDFQVLAPEPEQFRVEHVGLDRRVLLRASRSGRARRRSVRST